MSILDGLVRRDLDGFPSDDGAVVAWNDVAELLTNPADEQADMVAAAEFALRMGVSPKGYYRMPKWYREGARDTARRWMAAAAGGDDGAG